MTPPKVVSEKRWMVVNRFGEQTFLSTDITTPEAAEHEFGRIQRHSSIDGPYDLVPVTLSYPLPRRTTK